MMSHSIFAQNEEYALKVAEKSELEACECITQTRIDAADSCIQVANVNILVKRPTWSLKKIEKMFRDGTVEKAKLITQNFIRKNCEAYRTGILINITNSEFQKSGNDQANKYYIDGTTKMLLGELTAAINDLRSAINLDSTFVEVLDHLGFCHRNLNNNDSAIYYYNKSLELNPEGEVALVNIGLAYSQKDEHSTSLEFYNKLIKIDTTNIEGYFGKARELMYLNQNIESADNAFRAYKMYEAINSNYINDAVDLIAVLYQRFEELKQTDEILKLADKWNIDLYPE
jgi:tetratricopeptide (TPR) repeat protein